MHDIPDSSDTLHVVYLLPLQKVRNDSRPLSLHIEAHFTFMLLSTHSLYMVFSRVFASALTTVCWFCIFVACVLSFLIYFKVSADTELIELCISTGSA